MRACLFNTARRSSYLLCGYTQRVARVCATACPSLRHFIKVIIVLIVLLLSPVVTEAGFGSGHAVIGRDDPPPLCHGASVLCVRACAATPLFWYFIYSRNPRWLLWMSRSHSKLRMQVAAEKTTLPRSSHPLEFNSYGAEEALTSV